MAAAHHLQEVTRKEVEGRAKLGISAFAEALLGIPKILAENSGYDAQVGQALPGMRLHTVEAIQHSSAACVGPGPLQHVKQQSSRMAAESLACMSSQPAEVPC